jgi:hypothetical protein
MIINCYLLCIIRLFIRLVIVLFLILNRVQVFRPCYLLTITIHRLNLERLNLEWDFCPNGLNPEWD